MEKRPKVVLFLFVVQVLVNWSYVLWTRAQADNFSSGWFVVVPMLGFFYCFFAFIAAAGLYKGMKVGLAIAYGIILFGVVSAVISYNTVYRTEGMLEWVIIPLIVLNAVVVSYLMRSQKYFKSD